MKKRPHHSAFVTFFCFVQSFLGVFSCLVLFSPSLPPPSLRTNASFYLQYKIQSEVDRIVCLNRSRCAVSTSTFVTHVHPPGTSFPFPPCPLRVVSHPQLEILPRPLTHACARIFIPPLSLSSTIRRRASLSLVQKSGPSRSEASEPAPQ